MSDYQYTLYDKVRELKKEILRERQRTSKFKNQVKGRASLDMLSMFSKELEVNHPNQEHLLYLEHFQDNLVILYFH